jgi:hypothetical protein
MGNKNLVKLGDQQEIKEPEQFVDKNGDKILEYNNRTYREYVGKGLTPPDMLDYQEKQFLLHVDPTRKEVERTVTKIVRLMAPDYSDKKRTRKEYLMYYEEWRGVDWQGRKVPPVTDHIEGCYTELEFEPIIEKNRVVAHKKSGEHIVHYIPFSKEKVDEIISKSDGSYADTILYTVKGPEFRNGSYSYEQFRNLSYDDCVRLMNMKGGPRLVSNVLKLEQTRLEEEEALKKIRQSQQQKEKEQSNNNKSK